MLDEKTKEWLDKVGKDSYEKIEMSSSFAGVVTSSFLKSPLCALQIGYAVILGKPIILIVDKNLQLPQSLVKIAGLIERVDTNNPDDMNRAKQSIQNFCAMHGSN